VDGLTSLRADRSLETIPRREHRRRIQPRSLARENRQAFEDEYLLPFEMELPVTAMFTAMQQLENNLTAIEAAQIEAVTRPTGSRKEPTPPPN
jgi:hypothetical protein